MGNSVLTYILVTDKPWHDQLFNDLSKLVPGNWIRIQRKEDFTCERLISLAPKWVFIPHWSEIIQNDVFSGFTCVVFHMTDLPFGRGGSPLQNLILRGHKDTMISAIKVDKGIDTGDIYLKRPLSLSGTAREIFERSAEVIREMIRVIIYEEPAPVPQNGIITVFKRRTPCEGDISQLKEISTVFDYIRMLDCEGYPSAFIETEYFKMEFTNASLSGGENLSANVRITKK
jgi:methionyl-tRNA formyltransferase